jgi:hypothetical protein
MIDGAAEEGGDAIALFGGPESDDSARAARLAGPRRRATL